MKDQVLPPGTQVILNKDLQENKSYNGILLNEQQVAWKGRVVTVAAVFEADIDGEKFPLYRMEEVNDLWPSACFTPIKEFTPLEKTFPMEKLYRDLIVEFFVQVSLLARALPDDLFTEVMQELELLDYDGYKEFDFSENSTFSWEGELDPTTDPVEYILDLLGIDDEDMYDENGNPLVDISVYTVDMEDLEEGMSIFDCLADMDEEVLSLDSPTEESKEVESPILPTLPHWAAWMARDLEGNFLLFSDKPIKTKSGWKLKNADSKVRTYKGLGPLSPEEWLEEEAIEIEEM